MNSNFLVLGTHNKLGTFEKTVEENTCLEYAKLYTFDSDRPVDWLSNSKFIDSRWLMRLITAFIPAETHNL
jgi:hypothetical protein